MLYPASSVLFQDRMSGERLRVEFAITPRLSTAPKTVRAFGVTGPEGAIR
jgi:hypothetical protein